MTIVTVMVSQISAWPKLRPQGFDRYQATRVGVLGAGMMGAGIAYSCARAGMQVVLKDISQESADQGRDDTVKLNAKGIERGKLTQDKADELLARITATADPADLAGCDLAIEAVFEDPTLKATVFAEIAPRRESAPACGRAWPRPSPSPRPRSPCRTSRTASCSSRHSRRPSASRRA